MGTSSSYSGSGEDRAEMSAERLGGGWTDFPQATRRKRIRETDLRFNLLIGSLVVQSDCLGLAQHRGTATVVAALQWARGVVVAEQVAHSAGS